MGFVGEGRGSVVIEVVTEVVGCELRRMEDTSALSNDGGEESCMVTSSVGVAGWKLGKR